MKLFFAMLRRENFPLTGLVFSIILNLFLGWMIISKSEFWKDPNPSDSLQRSQKTAWDYTDTFSLPSDWQLIESEKLDLRFFAPPTWMVQKDEDPRDFGNSSDSIFVYNNEFKEWFTHRDEPSEYDQSYRFNLEIDRLKNDEDISFIDFAKQSVKRAEGNQYLFVDEEYFRANGLQGMAFQLYSIWEQESIMSYEFDAFIDVGENEIVRVSATSNNRKLFQDIYLNDVKGLIGSIRINGREFDD